MYGNDDQEWADLRRFRSYEGQSLTFSWHQVPWWVFWRTLRGQWSYRRIYDGADRGAGWDIQYATDVERARLALEERFGP